MEHRALASQNLIKRLRKLKQRKYREQEGLALVEGIHLIEEAIKGGHQLEQVIGTEAFYQKMDVISPVITDKLVDSSIPCTIAAEDVIKELSDTITPQGVLAAVRIPNTSYLCSLSKSSIDTNTPILVLNNLQDPGNLGTLIRTADAAGFSRVLLTNGTVDPYNPKVLRGAMGSHFHLQIGWIDNEEDFIQQALDANVELIVAHVDGGTNVFLQQLNAPLILVLGNEAHGPDKKWIKKATKLVKIPLLGGAESLNVATAGGIIMYEIVRQKGFDPA